MHASFPILSALVLLPILGAILVTVISNKHLEYVKLIAMLFSVGVGGMSIWLLASFHSHDSGFQFVSQHEWVSSWGISWHLGVDGVSLFLVVLTGILFPLVILGVDPHQDHNRY
jgi:NADH-quinone oxidoreductase subunit M